MKKVLIFLFVILSSVFAVNAANYFVKNLNEFNKSVLLLHPGDTITMANGIWENVNLHFKGNGTVNDSILLQAETPGKVIIEGVSSLKIDGDYLHVTGLLFTHGHGSGKYAISFAKSSNRPSSHSRMNNCAIIDFNQPERFKTDNWVAIFGKHNRFDHNYLAGKLNGGTTLVVKLNSTKSQNNYNRIDHNYFGERKRLGSNGGETMRIGTSTYSLTNSHTLVEDNYFEHCDGEVEIISVKSGDNIIRKNAFYECEGTLTLRHGNGNQIYQNIFIGNGKPFTGGVRVINMDHKVHDNYFFKLAGDRFRSALAVMNGVPNSAINRYHQVENVKIYHNTFIDCNHIEFGVGSDNERTAVPINTSFSNNIIYSSNNKNPISFMDNEYGITFSKNLLYAPKSNFHHDGFVNEKMRVKKDRAGFYNVITGNLSKNQKVGNIKKEILPQWKNAGPTWLKDYLRNKQTSQEKGKTIRVNNSPGALENAVYSAHSGDTILLVSAGNYFLSKPLLIDKPLFFRVDKNLKSKPILMFNNKQIEPAQIIIKNKGKLFIQGVAFNGRNQYGFKAKSGIKTDVVDMINHYELKVADCDFYNYTESTYNAFKAEKGSYADSIVFCNSFFHNISGTAISLASQRQDKGIYNAEYVTIKNCIFFNVMGAALNLYRGGNDESTLGPFLSVDHCLFENVNNKELGSVLKLIGVQYANITNSIFSNSGRGGRSIYFEETRWDHSVVYHCNFYHSGRVESFYNNVLKGKVYHIKPIYEDVKNFDFKLVNAVEFNKNPVIGLIYNKQINCSENFSLSVL